MAVTRGTRRDSVPDDVAVVVFEGNNKAISVRGRTRNAFFFVLRSAHVLEVVLCPPFLYRGGVRTKSARAEPCEESCADPSRGCNPCCVVRHSPSALVRAHLRPGARGWARWVVWVGWTGAMGSVSVRCRSVGGWPFLVWSHLVGPPIGFCASCLHIVQYVRHENVPQTSMWSCGAVYSPYPDWKNSVGDKTGPCQAHSGNSCFIFMMVFLSILTVAAVGGCSISAGYLRRSGSRK